MDLQGAIVLVLILGLSLGGYYALKRLRIRHDNPKYIPTSYLKRKYTQWQPDAVKKRRASSLIDRRSVQERHSPTPGNAVQRLSQIGTDGQFAGRNNDGTVNNRASVRSIMTLPAYSADVRDQERIIGREGERAGMDRVVEFPEDEAAAESRREEEMESLYQIRVRRRQERSAREERRRLRREARARNDRDALEALRAESRLARENGDIGSTEDMTAAQMLEEHRAQQRGRRLASVDYAELGVARHDGSRLRANSNESDRPLLSSAASMSGRNRGLSEPNTPPLPNNSSSTTLPIRGHAYQQSNSSLSRFATNAADISDMEDDMSDIEGGDFRPSTSHGSSAQDGRLSMSGRSGVYASHRGAAESSVDLGNHSLDTLPREHPPGYEESVRGQSSVDVSRQYSETYEDPEPQASQSSYSRGRRFGLPRHWGGRKQTRDEEAGREMDVRGPSPAQTSVSNRPLSDIAATPQSEAPPYSSRPVSQVAPQLELLSHIPSIEITPFTPTPAERDNDEHQSDERAWPL